MVLDLTDLTIEQAKLFDEIGYNIENDFNLLIEGMAKLYGTDITWWFTSIASRDIYQSDLFLRCCQLAFVKHYIENGEYPEAIIAEDIYTQKTLRLYFKNNNINISIKRKPKSLHWACRQALIPMLNLLRILLLFYCTRVYKCRVNKEQELRIVSIFAGDADIKSNKFVDRYYDALLDNDCSETFYYVPNVVFRVKNYVSNYKKLVNAKTLIMEESLKLSDFMKSIAFIYKNHKRKYKKDNWLFRGIDICLILSGESKSKCSMYSSITAYLKYLSIGRLKEKKIKIRTAIDWDEAQPINKGFVAGLRRYYPDTLIIGYRCYHFPSHVIHYSPVMCEKEAGLIPDVVGIIGSICETDARKYCNEINCKTVPAFRYLPSIYNSEKEEAFLESNIIAVGLSGFKNINETILASIIEISCTPEFENYTFIIKFHPDNSNDQINLFKKKAPPNCLVSNEPIGDIIGNSMVFIGGQTSVCLEALVKGIYLLVVVGEESLVINRIPNNVDKKLYKLCYTPHELQMAILDYINMDESYKNYIKAESMTLKEKCFQPLLSGNKLQVFLDIEREWINEKSVL